MPRHNAYLINFKDGSPSHIRDAATKLLAMNKVSFVTQNTSHMKTVQTIVTSLNTAITALIIITILLAVVILYNLTDINIAERIRELSTIKVLGFYNSEVTRYIYRETILLSFVGILMGLIAGRFLHRFIMDTIGSNTVQFGTTIDGFVYLISTFSILWILIVLNRLVHRRLKDLNMLDALQSVD